MFCIYDSTDSTDSLCISFAYIMYKSLVYESLIKDARGQLSNLPFYIFIQKTGSVNITVTILNYITGILTFSRVTHICYYVVCITANTGDGGMGMGVGLIKTPPRPLTGAFLKCT